VNRVPFFWLASAAIVTLAAGCGPSSSTTDANRQAAQSGIRAGDCSAAIDHLNRVIADDAADLVSRRDRANCYLKLHKLSQAISDYRAVADANLTTDSYLELAVAEWTAGQAEAAKEALKSASARTSDPSTLLVVAQTQASYGDAAAARSTLTKVSPGRRDFLWFAELGTIDGAEADSVTYEHDFSVALGMAPDSAKGSIFLQLGDARWKRARYADALESYQRAAANKGQLDTVHLYAQIADAYVHLGKLDNAVQNYQLALASRPDEDFRESLSLGLAKALIQLRRSSEAATLLSTLLSDPNVSADTAQQAKALQALIQSGK
jgi:tetratricopeptide (TPR) repeat protein